MLILVFIITMALCAVLAVGQNSRVYESEQLDRVGYGDVTSWIIEQPGVEELIDQIEELRGTEKTERQKIKQVLYKAGKKQTQNNGMLAVYEPENYDYYIYKEDLTGIQKNPKEPKDGEMYVSPSFITMYGAEKKTNLDKFLNIPPVSIPIPNCWKKPYLYKRQHEYTAV